VADWFVEVEELADYRLVVQMLRYGAESVILRDACHIVFAVVLPQGLDIPRDAFLDVPSAKAGLVDNLVERGAYTDELLTVCVIGAVVAFNLVVSVCLVFIVGLVAVVFFVAVIGIIGLMVRKMFIITHRDVAMDGWTKGGIDVVCWSVPSFQHT